jgi:hypothetical protein
MRRQLIAVLLLCAACGDPVHDAAVAALGPEAPGVPHGPYHRPGQPCLTCHGGDGPADVEMSFAGTIYAYQSGDAPAAGATLRIVDAASQTYETTVNCVGNFWIPRGRFTPVFPATTATTSGNRSRIMLTEMHRADSCSDCHVSPASSRSPGQVWVLPASDPAPEATCD